MAKFSPSPGFIELVKRVHDPKEGLSSHIGSIPTKKEDLWEPFLFALFIGQFHRGAQAVYARNVLKEHLALKQAKLAMTDANWSKRVLSDLDSTLKQLGKTPPDGLKRSVLEDVRSDVLNLGLVNTLAGMSGFVDGLDSRTLAGNRGDFDKEFNFVDSSVTSGLIPGVGYTKLGIWLQDLNAIWEITPPSGPVRWALSSRDLGLTGYNPSSPGEEERIGDLGAPGRTEFGGLCACYRTLCHELMPRVATDLKPIETQSAAWILGSTHGLLSGQSVARRKLTASAILDYVDRQGWKLDTYISRIQDIDRFGAVAKALSDGLR